MADDPEQPLNDEELRKVRMIVQQQDRMQWLWSTMRVWAMWITAVIVGATAAWNAFKTIVRGAAGT